jgi:hypothetical protein
MKKVLIAMVFILSPLTVSAAVGVGFGGLVTAVIPCGCSGGLWVWFTPLYTNSPVPVTGAIYFSALHTIPYSWYEFGVPATWELGTFIPGVQECFIPAGPLGCILLPTLGSMVMTGTSGLPGGL